MQSKKPRNESLLESVAGAVALSCFFWGLLMLEQWIIAPMPTIPGV